MKNPKRIIIVSDTVKDAHMGENRSGIRDDRDTLLGGSMTIKESSERLINLGIEREAVHKAVTENPRRYLQGS